ncbi:ABC transporter permease [Synoicihabitans lomoniglobus]|uniref:Autoinducer 2 import system permease protein LsrD n=1 Tax=Synoicihabitans lomoniglobus TaxID=2909285 RepID=A0AAF0CNM8_9BACT|nr:ABC transporter permease [Opitutaceae bacterium LMO-M01]WED65733.1 ABC transporter permease [Opitutaceae bacterium LMO-M01]
MSEVKSNWRAWLARPETILAILLVVEWLLFWHFGTTTNRRGVVVGFGTMDRQFDLLRHSCEIGLLALALTPVILTGGIDLSVGSLLGLCAVVFGGLWQSFGLPVGVAALATVAVGGVAGGINAGLVAKVRLPPLIVTLGTYSLFRGVAEGMTQGSATYTGFPAGFLALGQGRWLGVPTQLWLFAVVALLVWLQVHRTTLGRVWRAVGFAPEGARYAGLRVGRVTAWAYVMAGMIAGLAAVIYTARLGQARADAGTGYELFAITAVVLGGTSIFGGRGGVVGTLLGVAAIAVLKSGLATLPIVVKMNAAEEISGLLTGALLIAALAAGAVPRWWKSRVTS